MNNLLELTEEELLTGEQDEIMAWTDDSKIT